MSNEAMKIKSYRGGYQVFFDSNLIDLVRGIHADERVIIDAKVAELYAEPFADILARNTTLVIEATEQHKSLERMPEYALHMLEHGFRRNHTLVAIGGGKVYRV